MQTQGSQLRTLNFGGRTKATRGRISVKKEKSHQFKLTCREKKVVFHLQSEFVAILQLT